MLAGNALALALQTHAVRLLNMHRGVSALHCASVIIGLCPGPCSAKAAQTSPFKLRVVMSDARATVAVAVYSKDTTGGHVTNAVRGCM